MIEEIQNRENLQEYFKKLDSDEANRLLRAFIDSVREELLDPEDASIRASEKVISLNLRTEVYENTSNI